MKTSSFRSVVIIVVGALLTLTSCQYPYYYNTRSYGVGYNQRAGTIYGATGGALLGSLVSRRHPLRGALIGGVLGGVAGNAIGANRDRYYYTSGIYGSRSYRPYSYSRSYYSHPYYSNGTYYSPYYRRSSSSIYSYTNRPWGGGYGFGMPVGWGPGFGFGSRWF